MKYLYLNLLFLSCMPSPAKTTIKVDEEKKEPQRNENTEKICLDSCDIPLQKKEIQPTTQESSLPQAQAHSHGILETSSEKDIENEILLYCKNESPLNCYAKVKGSSVSTDFQKKQYSRICQESNIIEACLSAAEILETHDEKAAYEVYKKICFDEKQTPPIRQKTCESASWLLENKLSFGEDDFFKINAKICQSIDFTYDFLQGNPYCRKMCSHSFFKIENKITTYPKKEDHIETSLWKMPYPKIFETIPEYKIIEDHITFQTILGEATFNIKDHLSLEEHLKSCMNKEYDGCKKTASFLSKKEIQSLPEKIIIVGFYEQACENANLHIQTSDCGITASYAHRWFQENLAFSLEKKAHLYCKSAAFSSLPTYNTKVIDAWCLKNKENSKEICPKDEE